MEVLAKKMDRFGWERDLGKPVHDRLITDWMDALQDYPLDEIRAACREAVKAKPNSMPNEGHIVAEIMKARARFLLVNRPAPVQDAPREKASAERAAEIMAEVGFKPQRFGGDL